MFSACNNNKGIIEILLDYGADLMLQDKFGKRAWERTNSAEIKRILKPSLMRSKSKVTKPIIMSEISENNHESYHSKRMINDIAESDIERLENIAMQNVKTFAEKLNKKESFGIPKSNQNVSSYTNEECIAKSEVDNYINERIESVVKNMQKNIIEIINDKIDRIENIVKIGRASCRERVYVLV